MLFCKNGRFSLLHPVVKTARAVMICQVWIARQGKQYDCKREKNTAAMTAERQ